MKRVIVLLGFLFLILCSSFADEITVPKQILVLNQSIANVNNSPILEISAIDLSNNELVIITYCFSGYGSEIILKAVKHTGMTIDLDKQIKSIIK